MKLSPPARQLLVLLAAMALPLSQVRAAEVTDLASSFQPNNPFDARVTLTYRRHAYTGAITREQTGPGQTRIAHARELRFSHVQNVLSPRAEIGIWKDLQLHVELPVVIADSREFSFDQNGGDGCGDPPESNCITRNNSTLARDGFIDASQMSDDQTAVANSSGPPGGRLLPARAGIDQLYLGLTWAPMNQAHDDTKPTWVLGFEGRIAIGPVMTYDPKDPTANRSVGRGIHQLRFHTAVSRRFQYFDPWFSMYYMLPVADGSSLFNKTRFPESGQQHDAPQQMGGFEVGVEIVPWEQPEKHNKVSIELRNRLSAVFEGRGYSPMWELFARSTPLDGVCHPNPSNAEPGVPPPWSNGTYCASADDTLPHPGITRIENYLNYLATLAVNVHLTQYFYGRIGLSLGHTQAHLITNEDPGQSLAANTRIDATDPFQVNPLYRSVIDTVGRRFRVQDTTVFDVNVSLSGRF